MTQMTVFSNEARVGASRPAHRCGALIFGSCVLGVAILGAMPSFALDFDDVTWAELLESHTQNVSDPAGTRVDYVGLVADPRWRPFVDDLARRAPPEDRLGRMAFWIDTYNVLAIDMVVRHWPVESIRDVGSFFRRVWWVDAGTVDEADRAWLRGLGRDTRIEHFDYDRSVNALER